MAAIYSGMKDIMFGYDGDIYFEDGDLMLTSGGTDYIEREIYKLLITDRGQWKTNLRLGASPVVFAGQPNTRETAKDIQTYIKDSLAFTIAPATLDVRIIPTDYSTVIIMIDITSPDAVEISVPFEFSYSSGVTRLTRGDPRVVKATTGDYEVNDINNHKKPNKYWSRMSNSHFNSF